MPFIRGRYYINPVAGQALEAAREAEEALAAMRDGGHENDDDGHEGSRRAEDAAGKGPIHRVEIEAAEVVPTHSGRGQRGFVARIHRAGYAEPQDASDGAKFWGQDQDDRVGSSEGQKAIAGVGAEQAPSPETRMFSDHQDLVDFLRDEFAKDCRR